MKYRVRFDARDAPNLTMARVDVYAQTPEQAEMEVRAAFGIDIVIGGVDLVEGGRR